MAGAGVGVEAAGARRGRRRPPPPEGNPLSVGGNEGDLLDPGPDTVVLDRAGAGRVRRNHPAQRGKGAAGGIRRQAQAGARRGFVQAGEPDRGAHPAVAPAASMSSGWGRPCRSTTTPSPTLLPVTALPAPRGIRATPAPRCPADQGGDVGFTPGPGHGRREDPVDPGAFGIGRPRPDVRAEAPLEPFRRFHEQPARQLWVGSPYSSPRRLRASRSRRRTGWSAGSSRSSSRSGSDGSASSR